MTKKGQPTNQQRRREEAIRELTKVADDAKRPGVHPKQKLINAGQVAEYVALSLLKGTI